MQVKSRVHMTEMPQRGHATYMYTSSRFMLCSVQNREQGFSPDGTLRAKPCFYFDPRYLRQLHQPPQGILFNDKHQDTVSISYQEKTLHFKKAPLKNEHPGVELGGCCMVVSVTLLSVKKKSLKRNSVTTF